MFGLGVHRRMVRSTSSSFRRDALGRETSTRRSQLDLMVTLVAYSAGLTSLYVYSYLRVQRQLTRCFVDLLLPLSPNLPLLSPLFTSTLRSLTTGEYLHQPYFEVKRMGEDEVWRWVEERKWAYRGWSTSDSIPLSSLSINQCCVP